MNDFDSFWTIFKPSKPKNWHFQFKKLIKLQFLPQVSWFWPSQPLLWLVFSPVRYVFCPARDVLTHFCDNIHKFFPFGIKKSSERSIFPHGNKLLISFLVFLAIESNKLRIFSCCNKVRSEFMAKFGSAYFLGSTFVWILAIFEQVIGCWSKIFAVRGVTVKLGGDFFFTWSEFWVQREKTSDEVSEFAKMQRIFSVFRFLYRI